MISINEIKRKLPKDFIDSLYENYSPLIVDNILIGMRENRQTTLRVNTIKYNIQELMKYFKERNIKFERVPFYDNSLIIKNATEKDLVKLDIYSEGKIYLQSLSSMVPPLVLNPKEGEKVLDLTAAPGSKTTQIAALMKNNGYILANELDKIRYERLKYNIEEQGVKIAEIINGRGEKIGEEYPEYFDKVLLDTPCSGEGRFIATNAGTYRDWSIRTVNTLLKTQKKLIESAYKSLKKDGILVYSTCTLNKLENENILEYAMENFKLKLEKIDLKIKGSEKAFDSEKYELNKAIRILPSKTMEGFFVGKFRKYEN